MKRLIYILLFLLSLPVIEAQYPQRTWVDSYSYNQGRFVVSAPGKIYCSTASGIIVADTDFNSVTRLSTVHGLTETNLSTIAWSDETSTLVIAYNSTNIDLLKGNTITNIPDIMRKNIPGLKEIYRLRTKGSRGYLAGSFGIVVLDLAKQEIFDTWKPGQETNTNPVFDITFDGDRILAATASGVYEASLSNQGLAWFGSWTRHNDLPSPSATYNCIAKAGDNLFVNRQGNGTSGDSVFIFNGSWQYLYRTNGTPVRSFESTAGNELIVSTGTGVRTYNSSGVFIREVSAYGQTGASPSNAIKTGTTLWIADTRSGLVSIPESSGFDFYLPDGPAYNDAASLYAADGRLYIAGGSVDNAWNNTWKMLRVSQYSEKRWRSLAPSVYRDAMRVLPGKNNNYFVTTWGMGLLEYSDTTLLNHYNEYNSPLTSIIPGQPYTRLCGMAYDDEENLWIIHSGVENNFKVLRPDRTWITLPVKIDAPSIGDLIITRNGIKWVVLPRGQGLFILDDNKTPDIFSDDSYRKMIVRDTDDKVLSNIYSVTEDLDGNVWVGTDQGPAIYYNPDRAAREDIRAVRIKIPRNDGTGLADYLLGTEIITSIAIDGANRKWIGTFNSGAYLLSPDGTATIARFNTGNSPLPSNTVISIASDLSTGLIWFGTSEGVIAYRSDAPAGENRFSSVYAYPNPVRPEYNGPVTIAGLVRDTNIRITDISGNLVFETTSTGSEANWDLMNYRGERVSSGVYLVFCAAPDGAGSAITKILVVTSRQ